MDRKSGNKIKFPSHYNDYQKSTINFMLNFETVELFQF